MHSVGDLARFYSTTRMSNTLRSTVSSAGTSATTGQVNDKAKHLGGSAMSLTLMDRKLSIMSEQLNAVAEAKSFATATQATLDHIRSAVDQSSNDLALASQMSDETQLDILSENARVTLDNVVGLLNTEAAGRFLFSGSKVVRPVAESSQIISDVKAALPAAASLSDITTVVDAYFDAGGAYLTSNYSGSETGFARFGLAEDHIVDFPTRADDVTLRQTIKSLVFAVLASEPTLNLNTHEKQVLMNTGRDGLNIASGEILSLQSNVGLAEQNISQVSDRLLEERSKLQQQRQELIGVDMFEQISLFEAAQQQLDISYRIASRQSEVSLAGYLR